MTDINSNIGADKINQVQNLNFAGSGAENVQPQNYTDKEIKNLDNAHSALVGRSMVKKMQKQEQPKIDPILNSPLAERVKSDLVAFKGSERIVGLSDKIFEKALENGHSYEEAAKIQQEAVEYFKGN